ncbi:MAG TPA: DUF262 domain-containing protein [Flavobacterium sp.]|nr:DUF262 domain-containing protein [Flavobacterium sp.]
MEQNLLEPKTIKELITIKESFYVDSYQRGYRWGIPEVEALLKDIDTFSKNRSENEIYWLQPIVVKKIFKKETAQEVYELIDGQQRLTTIFLILSYLKNKLNISIDYNTRTSSSAFLNRLNDIDPFNTWPEYISKYPKDNKIDNFHFFQAITTIKNWFENNPNDKFINCLLNSTQIIWYEVRDSSEPKDIFQRINVGKIPLTNAELIKALYLNNKVNIQKRNEIAEKWDRIEYGLKDDKLWYFLNQNQNEMPNRIEFIFNLISEKFKNDKNKEEKLHTFLFFNDSKNREENWKQVEIYYNTFLEWYEKPELYHYIGFLITTGFENAKSLIKRYNKGIILNDPKSTFLIEIKGIIKDNIKDYNIEDLSYDKKNDYHKLINTLLLFNIHTTLKTTPDNYFPFEKYKRKHWSLEHIHAQQSKELTDKDAVLGWINETSSIVNKFISDKLKSVEAVSILEELNNIKVTTKPDIKNIQERVFNFFSDNNNEHVHSISNMALLDRDINSALNNSIYPIKRVKIFDTEKTSPKDVFVPICTKNVFLKYYSQDISQMYFWSTADKSEYLNEIQKCFNYYVTTN